MEKEFWRVLGKLTLLAAVFAAGQACTASEDPHIAQNNYWHYCSSCHGREGKGDGMMVTDMPVRPNDHTDADIMRSRSDELLFKIISEGGAATGFDEGMPAHKKFLKEDEIKGLVKYIRKLCNCKYVG